MGYRVWENFTKEKTMLANVITETLFPYWWSPIALVLLIGLIVFFFWYRKRQV